MVAVASSATAILVFLRRRGVSALRDVIRVLMSDSTS